MKYIEELLSQRQLLANNYIQLLDNHPKIKFQKLSPLSVHSYQSFCVFTSDRDNVINTMREQGIEVQIGTYSLHMHKAYNNNTNCKISGTMEGSRYAFEHCLALPLFHDLRIEEQEYIVGKLTQIIP
jgi:dTDP-4-amino-4,6-dideoxygalactose transaminase